MWGRGRQAALRANGLARGTDLARLRLRRALRWALVLLAVPAAALGVWTRAASAPQLASASAHRHAVAATVLGTAPSRTPAAARVPSVGGGTGLEVAWKYPVGESHRAVIKPPPGWTSEGVRVWVDDAGRLTSPPPTAATVSVNAVVYALGAWFFGGLLLALGHALLRRRLDLRDARAWADEWAEVEPYWSGRRRHGTADR